MCIDKPAPTILLVEDSATEMLRLSTFIKNLGYQLVTASNGLKAVKYLKEMDFDLIVSDWRMPFMDGLQLCHCVQAIPASRRPYFIMLTGKANTEHMVSSIDAGADDYIVKPLNTKDFRIRLQAGLRLASSRVEH